MLTSNKPLLLQSTPWQAAEAVEIKSKTNQVSRIPGDLCPLHLCCREKWSIKEEKPALEISVLMC